MSCPLPCRLLLVPYYIIQFHTMLRVRKGIFTQLSLKLSKLVQPKCIPSPLIQEGSVVVVVVACKASHSKCAVIAMACLVSQRTMFPRSTAGSVGTRHKRTLDVHVNGTNGYCRSGRFHYFAPSSAPVVTKFRFRNKFKGYAVFCCSKNCPTGQYAKRSGVAPNSLHMP